MGKGWEKCTPNLRALLLRSTWHNFSRAFILAMFQLLEQILEGNIPPYSTTVRNPCKTIKKRFSEEIEALLKIKWRDWEKENIFKNLKILCSANVQKIKEIC